MSASEHTMRTAGRLAALLVAGSLGLLACGGDPTLPGKDQGPIADQPETGEQDAGGDGDGNPDGPQDQTGGGSAQAQHGGAHGKGQAAADALPAGFPAEVPQPAAEWERYAAKPVEDGFKAVYRSEDADTSDCKAYLGQYRDWDTLSREVSGGGYSAVFDDGNWTASVDCDPSEGMSVHVRPAAAI